MSWPPIDPSVVPEVARFDPTVPTAEARTPPSAWYTAPAFDVLDRHAVFGRSWQLAARVDQLAVPGAFVAGEVAGLPFVVVRGDDGGLLRLAGAATAVLGVGRAFHNACRHRATAVACGEGVARGFTCPYHGWRYHLDGRLASAPRAAGLAGLDPDRFALPALAVMSWGPLVLVHADRGASPPPDLAALDHALAPSGWAQATFLARCVWDLACNWKVFCDNYLDGGYHVPVAHPALAAQLDLGGYRTELLGASSLQSAPPAAPGDARIGAGAIYGFVHPNLMINRYGPVLDTNLVVPTGPASCRVVFDFYVDPAVRGDAAFLEATLAQSDATQREDVALCESVQRGLASPSYDRGPYAPRVEAAVHHFHRLLAADYAAVLSAWR